MINHLGALGGTGTRIAFMQVMRQDTCVLALLIVAAFSGALYPVDLPPAYRATFS